MWLYRGAQSAVFYYATCTPCAMSIDQRKRRKEAARSQRLKQKSDFDIVTDQPRPFPQPTPFSTNEGWRAEIALGPGPPARRGHRHNPRTNSWNTDQSAQIRKDKSGSLMQPFGERLNWMRYQREDEPLWGQEVRGSSIGFSGGGRADPNEPAKYYAARVPPVNDLHPPIVSGPRSRAETRWMLQPPPSARVMAGKERFNMSPCDNVGGFPGNRLSRLTETTTHRDKRNSDRITGDIVDEELVTDAVHQNLPSRPSATRVRGRSDSIGPDNLNLSRHSRSDSMFSTASTDNQSLSASWKYPDTPGTRPGTKSTDDSEKMYARPQISKTLSTLQRGNKNKVHLLHLEINDDPHGEVDFGQLERVRPWRWSMDI